VLGKLFHEQIKSFILLSDRSIRGNIESSCKARVEYTSGSFRIPLYSCAKLINVFNFDMVLSAYLKIRPIRFILSSCVYLAHKNIKYVLEL
jgi:hypothetical protein